MSDLRIPEDTEWKQVTYKKKVSQNGEKKKQSEVTIFLHGIPNDAEGKDIWNLFQNCGKILDIILPRKRDKIGKRFGFIKTTSEREAGNKEKESGKKSSWTKKTFVETSTRKAEVQHSLRRDKTGLEDQKNEEIPFSKKMIEFIEVEIDEEVEQSKIGYSWFEEDALIMQERFKDMGLASLEIMRK
ncbi:hypothetical protein ACET3Z_002025 [Daucus carota]